MQSLYFCCFFFSLVLGFELRALLAKMQSSKEEKRLFLTLPLDSSGVTGLAVAILI
jgi:hypothetical protein